MELKCTIYGSRGYLGRELVRILNNHPEVDTILPISGSSAGQPYGEAVPGFSAIKQPFVTAETAVETGADVVFFATSHGEAKAAAPNHPDALLIDLSRDHRLEAIAGGPWSYNLADLNPAKKGIKKIANPGCYPTASLLAAKPALDAGLATGPLIVDGKSSISGAGATARDDLHFPAANEAVRAYKVLGHDHQAEIKAAAGHLKTRFTPHLVPMNRGLLSTVYLQTDASAEEIKTHYAKTYESSPFVTFGVEPDTSHVIRSNNAQLAVDVDDGIMVARCAIDNLQKGGSGQAVQNMNDALGLPSTTGLLYAGGGP